MPKGEVFWIIYLLMVLGGCGWYWRVPEGRRYGVPMVILLVLVGIIGWAQFGPPIR